VVYRYGSNNKEHDTSSLNDYLVKGTEQLPNWSQGIYGDNGFYYSVSKGIEFYSFEDQKIYHINNDMVSSFSYIGDGYIYYKPLEGSVDFCRVKSDGTDWEDMSWMFTVG